MKCPTCGRLTRVIETVRAANVTRRRRECSAGHRSTSIEMMDRRGPDRPGETSLRAREIVSARKQGEA